MKKERIDGIREEVWGALSGTQSVYLATAEADQPRVRPVTLLNIDRKLWIATGQRSAKVRQIRRNPNVEFCLPLSDERGNGYLRVAGLASVVTDPETRETIGGKIPFLDEYWSGPDDPDFCLLRITRVEVEYLRPGEMDPYAFIV
jgi:general stress protein 26